MSRINLDQLVGFFIGGAIGDALGMPVEGLTREEIIERFSSIQYYLKSDGAKISFLRPGQYTDDTQLMIASVKAIINYPQFSARNFATEYLYSKENLRSIGKATWTALNNLQKGVDFKRSGIDSLGCGFLSRTSPVAFLFDKYTDPHFDIVVEDIIRMTHNNDDAVRFSFIYYSLLQTIYKNQNVEIDTAALLDKYSINPLSNNHKKFVDSLGHIKTALSNDSYISSTTGSAIDVLSAALFCFLRTPRNFEESVLYAVNLGGDTDSIGFITGQLSGLYNGISKIPHYFRKGLENNQDIQALAEIFYNHIER